MADKQENTLWVELQTGRKYTPGNTHVIVRLVPVTVKERYSQPLKVEYFYGQEPYSGLEAYEYIWQEWNVSPYFEVRYLNPSEVKLHFAKAMVAVLGSIERKFEKAMDAEGSPKTAGQWALRFVKAIGAAGLVYTDTDGSRRTATNGQTVETVDRLLAAEKKWVDEQKGR
jgi:hypothetical protein